MLTLAAMKSLSDKALFELIQQSDYEAFNELYKRSWKNLYTIAHKKTGSREDAFDLVQNVFMGFYDKRVQLQINIPIQDYLRNALIFKLSDYFRARGFQEKHYKNLELFMANRSMNEHFHEQELEMAENEYQDILDLIYQTIDDMPEKMREIFLISRSENYSINQIAEKLNLSPQTVKNQISKAYAKIRQNATQHHISTAKIAFIIWLMNS